MGIIISVGLCCLVLISLVLPWIHRIKIQELRDETNAIKRQMRSILQFVEKQGMDLPENLMPQTKSDWQHTEQFHIRPPIIKPEPISEPKLDEESPVFISQELEDFTANSKSATPENQKKHISFEQQFGAFLPVWIGGISLALAGFFMVKYSIETGILNPNVRVILGTIFGIALLYAGNLVRNKPEFANGKRISQALSGAGIADLYVCIFAATNLYDIIPTFVGFAGMAVVTATAVLLSLQHGMPIALLGLVGGFMTPAMIGSNDPQAPILFIYLYFVLAGIMVVARKKCWWIMAIPTVIGAFSWVCLWLFGGNFSSGDTIYLGLFMMAVSATVIAISNQQYIKDSADEPSLFKLSSALNYLTLGCTMLITAIMTAHAGFGLMEWSLFGLISVGGIALAFFNQKLYGLAPWLSMVVNAVMLLAWNVADTNAFALTIIIFGSLYIVSGYLLQSRSEKPVMWAGLTAAASIGYYLIAYYKLHYTNIVSDIPLFWGLLAIAFAGLGTIALEKIMKAVAADNPQKQKLMAIYASTVTAFISIALTIELSREFLSVAFAAQLLAITWINTKVDVAALRYIAGILVGVFGFLLIPQILLLVQLSAYSLVEAQLALQQGIPIMRYPTFQLGLPALFFLIGSYLLRIQKDDNLVRVLEIAAIALSCIMGYYLTRHIFHSEQDLLFVKAGFVERGVITNILFVYGLACLWLGRNFTRQAISLCGLVLCCVAIFRINYFDLVVYNPVWTLQKVGELPILNALLLTYGLPIFWTQRTILELPYIRKSEWIKRGYSFIMLLCFVLISMNVRQFFQGTYLNSYNTTNAEIYAYSVVWLLFGIVLLFLGTLRKDKMIRIASLAIMILTIGKVFLYDASELEGLFRVFSFFGLGISLLILSWFYTRFVFEKP